MAQEMRALFDEFGRCIPVGVDNPVHEKTRRYFGLSPIGIDYDAIHQRIGDFLNVEDLIGVDEFRSRIEALVSGIKSQEEASNVLNGHWIPFILPRQNYEDIGAAMEEIYIPAVEAAFKERYPEYSFYNHCQEGLRQKLSVVPKSRHDRLLDRSRHEHLVGCYFPSLSEYSVPAAVEKVNQLPDQFFLAGGYDTAAVLIGTPGLLLRTDGYPPLLWLAALQEQKQEIGYHFESYGYNLTFNRRNHLNQTAESWSSGLVVLG